MCKINPPGSIKPEPITEDTGGREADHDHTAEGAHTFSNWAILVVGKVTAFK